MKHTAQSITKKTRSASVFPLTVLALSPAMLAGRFTCMPALAEVQGAAQTSESRESGLLLQAEKYSARSPDDGTFAKTTRSPFASGGVSVTRFFLKDGRCDYRFAIQETGEYGIWLRYAANHDQRVRFAVNPGPQSDSADARSTLVKGSGALDGQSAWKWTLLGRFPLAAGEHDLTLYAGTYRPDCFWISQKAPPPDGKKMSAERLARVRSHLAAPIEPISPDWLHEADGYELPKWYDEIRVCAHTRLSWPWLKKNPELFLKAGREFSALGFKEFSRHIKSGGEPAWWASEVGAVAPDAHTTNYAKRIIDDAHTAGCRILVYHRHVELAD